VPLIRRLELPRDPQLVFEAITDVTAIPHWIPAIRSAQVTGGLPLRRGSVFVQHAKLAFFPFLIVGRVERYEPPNYFAYRYDRGIVAGDWRYRMVASGPGTLLEVAVDFHIARPLRPIVARIVAANIDRFAAWVTGWADA
jgi:uncharacterized protein YndB with AHSA1/START domain